MEYVNDQLRMKSLKCEEHSFIVFFNRTSRDVDIIWCDYKGKEVRYQTLKSAKHLPEHDNVHLRAEQKYAWFSIDTFVTHPWIARDSKAGHLLLLNHKATHLPVAFQGEQERPHVYVDIPVIGLKERCLEEVRKVTNIEELTSWEVPVTLIKALKSEYTPS